MDEKEIGVKQMASKKEKGAKALYKGGKKLTGDALKRERKRRLIASRKAREKRKGEKIEKGRKRVDPGLPPGAQVTHRQAGTPKKGIQEEMVQARAKRPSEQPKFKGKVSPEIKLQREWDGMTSAARRAERVKYKETGKSKYGELIERGSAKTGGQGRKNIKREALLDAALGTFKRGGLAKKGHKDYRKGGMFY